MKIITIGYFFDKPILKLEFEESFENFKNIKETVDNFIKFERYEVCLLESQDNDYYKTITFKLAEYIIVNWITDIDTLEQYIKNETLGFEYLDFEKYGCRIISLTNNFIQPVSSDFYVKKF
jgi:hypothetical protein